MAKKKKVRVAFKKNRQKRTRANDLTSQYRRDELARAEPLSGERIRAKGELSRHRTIVTDTASEAAGDQQPDESSALRAVDLETCLAGRILRVHGR